VKLTLTFKDPDHACTRELDGANVDVWVSKLPARERAAVERFVEWDEYVTIEIDTETRTARVVEVKS
jgi:hypothetical protein